MVAKNSDNEKGIGQQARKDRHLIQVAKSSITHDVSLGEERDTAVSYLGMKWADIAKLGEGP